MVGVYLEMLQEPLQQLHGNIIQEAKSLFWVGAAIAIAIAIGF